MQAPGARIEQSRERIDIGVFELRHLAVLHEQRGKLVSRFRELLQHARVG
jgi:hypothetical protein